MQIELTDEEAALCIIGVGRSLQEIPMLARAALEGSDKRKPIWTPEMKVAASRSGKLLKKLMASLAQSREAHNSVAKRPADSDSQPT